MKSLLSMSHKKSFILEPGSYINSLSVFFFGRCAVNHLNKSYSFYSRATVIVLMCRIIKPSGHMQLEIYRSRVHDTYLLDAG